MSQENVELVRKLVEAVGSGDYETAARHLDPAVEWHNTTVFPGPTTVVGADAIVEFWRDLFGVYRGGSSGMEVEDVVDTGQTVVVRVHGWGSGASSGVPIDARWAHILRFRGTKILRVDTYGHFASALEAAGLRE